jgi:hypothetical protein
MHRRMLASTTAFVMALLLIVLTWAGGTAGAAGGSLGGVYILTRDPTENAVSVFSRAANGCFRLMALSPQGIEGAAVHLIRCAAHELARA